MEGEEREEREVSMAPVSILGPHTKRNTIKKGYKTRPSQGNIIKGAANNAAGVKGNPSKSKNCI